MNQTIGQQQQTIAIQQQQIASLNQSIDTAHTASTRQQAVTEVAFAQMNQTISMINQSIITAGPRIPPISSCAGVLSANTSAVSGIYNISIFALGVSWPVWCEMRNGTAWTLLMKIDGSQTRFSFSSSLWTTSSTLNEPLSLGQDNLEYKSVLYNMMPFTQLLLGMRSRSDPYTATRWTTMSYAGASLLDVISRPQPTLVTSKNSTVARADFLSIVGPDAESCSLQPYCNQVGFNLIPDPDSASGVYYSQSVSLRIGIIANEQVDCGSPDSFIGFGGYHGVPTQSLLASGCRGAFPGGSNSIPRFGYILAR